MGQKGVVVAKKPKRVRKNLAKRRKMRVRVRRSAALATLLALFLAGCGDNGPNPEQESKKTGGGYRFVKIDVDGYPLRCLVRTEGFSDTRTRWASCDWYGWHKGREG